MEPDIGVTPPPLSKRRRNGELYKRRPGVEATLARILAMSREELLARLSVRDTASPHHVPSECLVHLLRHVQRSEGEAFFRSLYREVVDRIDKALPRLPGERIGTIENVHGADARDRVRDAFNQRLAEDRQTPGPGLDYFEVMFADAIAALRATAMEGARRAAKRNQPIERDEETNEPSAEVERARGSFDVVEELRSEDPIYRSHILAAISQLPPKQRRVIEMIIQEFPLDSSDDATPSIRSSLGVVEKTVRNRRDAAIVSIRKAIGLENGDE